MFRIHVSNVSNVSNVPNIQFTVTRPIDEKHSIHKKIGAARTAGSGSDLPLLINLRVRLSPNQERQARLGLDGPFLPSRAPGPSSPFPRGLRIHETLPSKSDYEAAHVEYVYSEQWRG
jgi:hypothetical protein